MTLLWADRTMWSGEIPLDYPELGPVALCRITPTSSTARADEVDAGRTWDLINSGSGTSLVNGPWGQYQVVNNVAPATSQTRMTLTNFAGLWPSSGRLLIGQWQWQGYTMTFNPFLSTRSSGVPPLAYLSSHTSGQPRHQLYSSTGTLVLDQYEASPWSASTEWMWIGQLIDMDAWTSQLLTIDYATGQSWASPVRTASAAPNGACTANLDVFALQVNSYWSGGGFDEVLVAHPTAAFDAMTFLDTLRRGTWAKGQYDGPAIAALDVTDTEVTAVSSYTLETGAEPVSWTIEPTTPGAPAGATPYWSTDDGATWSTGATLPAPFTGLLRWLIPMGASDVFTGIDLVEPVTPAPVLDPISDVSIEQGETATVPLSYEASGTLTWQIDAPSLVTATKNGDSIDLLAGYATGSALVTVTVTDDLERSASQSFTVTVTVRNAVVVPPPAYSGSPIVLWGDDEPEAVVVDPGAAVVLDEINGESSFTFTLPADHPRASVLLPERRVEVAGDIYRTRRITTSRRTRGANLEIYCEALFYDLATAEEVDGRDWAQVVAGDVMVEALAGTGWTVGAAEVTNLRTYTTDAMNPLALLREVASQHGGDLVFDNHAKTVSLLVQAGRDNGVAFFYGRGLAAAKRIVDTTSLVTRIYARNADGETIASVNDGVPYLEDFSYTDELKVATYNFAAGTSPFTMLSMTQATLALRSQPEYSYEVTVADLSTTTGQEVDRFGPGDLVTVADAEIGMLATQRIVRLEYDTVRPWKTKLTLSARLRESGRSDAVDAGVLTTGSTIPTFDLVPFNLLLNGRFDNGLQHWANSGVTVVDAGQGTGDYVVQFTGTGARWIEQTVQPDVRDAYALSLDIEADGPDGFVPDLVVQATVIYEDGTTETISIDLE